MAKESGEAKLTAPTPKELDKAKLRRAYGCVDSVTDLLGQIKDILKSEPDKAALVIESLKKTGRSSRGCADRIGILICKPP